jgi:hypothetical protein
MFDYLQPADRPVVDGLESKEHVFAKNQPEYNPLRALVSETAERRVISRWTLSPEQRTAVAEGADIFLMMLTFGQPLQPINMAVSDTSGERFTEWFEAQFAV